MPDVLLKQVGLALTEFADEHLRPLLRDAKAKPFEKELATRFLLLQWRSRDAFQDFGEFYCIRLLLDQQWTLASYFIDLFADLHPWILRLLHFSSDSGALLVHRIAATFRLFYALDKLSPYQGLSERDTSEEFRIGRMFSHNKLHCRMRQLGFVNLDQPGKCVVSLKEELGRGGFATVYKGVFEADHTVEKNRKMIGGDPVAVKMFTNDNEISDSGMSFGSQLLQSMIEVTHLSASDKMLPEWSEALKDDRLVSVKHPNIVTPTGYIGKRPQGGSGLVMEVMDKSPHDYLQKVEGDSVSVPLAELEMLDLMLEIAKGM
ncbi:hypothetical protein L7F22_065718 [Adiantum nelumboides]|nr:hypothetical protein [Adiantum nelumboides]